MIDMRPSDASAARLLLLGATGLVGQATLARLLADDRVERVVAPTRRALEVHPKLRNPVGSLVPDADWGGVDAVICALGTTRALAGSAEAFRRIDRDLPLAFARSAIRQGARTFVLNSSLGADARSRLLYPRTKGELEETLRAIGFDSLTIVRPSLIGGARAAARPMEQLATLLLRAAGSIVPKAYRINPAERIAEAMVEAALAATPGTHVIPSDQLI